MLQETLQTIAECPSVDKLNGEAENSLQDLVIEE